MPEMLGPVPSGRFSSPGARILVRIFQTEREVCTLFKKSYATPDTLRRLAGSGLVSTWVEGRNYTDWNGLQGAAL